MLWSCSEAVNFLFHRHVISLFWFFVSGDLSFQDFKEAKKTPRRTKTKGLDLKQSGLSKIGVSTLMRGQKTSETFRRLIC